MTPSTTGKTHAIACVASYWPIRSSGVTCGFKRRWDAPVLRWSKLEGGARRGSLLLIFHISQGKQSVSRRASYLATPLEAPMLSATNWEGHIVSSEANGLERCHTIPRPPPPTPSSVRRKRKLKKYIICYLFCTKSGRNALLLLQITLSPSSSACIRNPLLSP